MSEKVAPKGSCFPRANLWTIFRERTEPLAKVRRRRNSVCCHVSREWRLTGRTTDYEVSGRI